MRSFTENDFLHWCCTKASHTTPCPPAGCGVRAADLGLGCEVALGMCPAWRLWRPHPSLAALPLREQGVTGPGMSQDVTRDGMCCDAAETSNCLEAGLGLGGGKGNSCVMEVSPGHTDLLGPEGTRVQPGHCPVREFPGTPGHHCKALSGQVAPAPAAWRSPHQGDRWVLPGINRHK